MIPGLLRWIVLAALLLPVALVARAPARLLAVALDDGGGRWRVQSATGTLWSGRAALEFLDESAWREAGLLDWQWQPAALMEGVGSFRISLQDGAADLRLGAAGWELVGLRLRLPAAAVLGALPVAPQQARWQGEFTVSTARWRCRWPAWPCEGEAGLDWTGAGALALAEGLRLGSYEARLSAGAQGLSGTAHSTAGPLLLEASLLLNASRQGRLTAELWTDAAQGANPGPFLDSLGVPRAANGRYRVALELGLASPGP